MKNLKAPVAAVALALISQSISAQSVDETLLQSARAVARITLIEPVCEHYYVLDRKVLNEVTRGLVSIAVERFGADTVRAMANRVRPELITEAKRVGAARWCPAQRQFYKRGGVPEFIGSALP